MESFCFLLPLACGSMCVHKLLWLMQCLSMGNHLQSSQSVMNVQHFLRQLLCDSVNNFQLEDLTIYFAYYYFSFPNMLPNVCIIFYEFMNPVYSMLFNDFRIVCGDFYKVSCIDTSYHFCEFINKHYSFILHNSDHAFRILFEK